MPKKKEDILLLWRKYKEIGEQLMGRHGITIDNSFDRCNLGLRAYGPRIASGKRLVRANALFPYSVKDRVLPTVPSPRNLPSTSFTFCQEADEAVNAVS